VSVGLVNVVIPFLKGSWKCGLILHHFLASWTGGSPRVEINSVWQQFKVSDET